MLEKITKLNGLGPFTGNVWPDTDFQFNVINLLYGFNGSGKTMFSNVLRIFGEDLDNDSKDEIFNALKNDNGTMPEIELLFEGKRQKSYTNPKKILVFNSHFVSEHVYDGSNAKVKKFKGGVVTSEHLKNPQIKKIEKQITDKIKQKSENSDEISHLTQLANETKNTLSSKWNKSITGHRLPTKLNLNDASAVPKQLKSNSLKTLEAEIEEHYRKFKISKRNHDIQNDIETVKIMAFDNLNIDADINDLLSKKVSEDVLKKVKDKLSKFKDLELAHASVQDWFEDGVTLLEHSKSSKTCPLCDSTIPNVTDIIHEYNEFFNEEFTALQSDLGNVEETLKSLKSIVEVTEKNMALLTKLINKYGIQEKIDDNQQSVLNDFTIDKISEAINEVVSLISKKQKNLGVKFSNEELKCIESLSTENIAYNDTVQKIGEIKTFLESELAKSSFSLESARNTAKDLYWARLDIKLKDRIKEYKEKGKGAISATFGLEFYHAINKEKSDITEEITKLNLQRSGLLAKLKKESEFVNLFLTQLCISHFTIRVPEAEDEEIEIIYKGSTPKRGLRYSLSEGEKTALAFAYFLSKIKYEIIDNTQEQLSEFIIVIDDPVSSLDENRLFSTALLIKKMFVKEAKQLFVLSHNLIFLKFMGNILENDDNDKREDCYIENGQITRLPKSLCNYQTSYFYKIKKLQEYLAGNIDYDIAKDFIPNCARVVLETFLSFKLCRLKQKSGNPNKYKSAGLDKLIPALYVFKTFRTFVVQI